MIFLVMSRPEWPGTDISMVAAAIFVIGISVVRGTPWTARLSPAMLAFLAFALLSIGWSTNIESTLIYMGASLCTTVCALYIVSVPSPSELKAGLMRGCKAAALASLTVGIFVPAIGIMGGVNTAGSLIGIYPHRNVLAGVLGFGVILAVSHVQLLGRTLIGKLFWVAIFGVALVMAGSSTSIVAILIAVSAGGVVLVLRRTGARSASLPFTMGGMAILIGTYLVISQLPLITSLLGRSATLSGRTNIWSGVLKAARENPFGGTGWGAAWGDNLGVAATVRGFTNYFVTDAHNGYLDVLAQLGLIGLVLFLAFFFSTVVRGLQFGLHGTDITSLWPIMAMTLLGVTNLSESRAHEFLGWFTVVIVYSLVAGSRSDSDGSAGLQPLPRVPRKAAQPLTSTKPR